MQMVKIQLIGDRGKTALTEMCRLGRAFHEDGDFYLVPDFLLERLDKFGASFRRFNTDGYPNRSLTDPFLEAHCGKVVVEKVSHSEEAACRKLTHANPKYRFAALSLIKSKWGCSQKAADRCETML